MEIETGGVHRRGPSISACLLYIQWGFDLGRRGLSKNEEEEEEEEKRKAGDSDEVIFIFRPTMAGMWKSRNAKLPRNSASPSDFIFLITILKICS